MLDYGEGGAADSSHEVGIRDNCRRKETVAGSPPATTRRVRGRKKRRSRFKRKRGTGSWYAIAAGIRRSISVPAPGRLQMSIRRLQCGGSKPQQSSRTRKRHSAPSKLISNSTPTVDFSGAAARADVLFVLLRHPRTRTPDDELVVAGRGQCQTGTGLRAVMDCSQLHDLGRQTRQPQELFIG